MCASSPGEACRHGPLLNTESSEPLFTLKTRAPEGAIEVPGRSRGDPWPSAPSPLFFLASCSRLTQREACWCCFLSPPIDLAGIGFATGVVPVPGLCRTRDSTRRRGRLEPGRADPGRHFPSVRSNTYGVCWAWRLSGWLTGWLARSCCRCCCCCAPDLVG